MPAYSVIIPIYNNQKTIERIVGQILDANFPNIELILVDDGSSDDSLKTAKDLARQDSRIVVIHQENAGPSAARNHGLRVARGQFVIFCDADDEIKTESFSQALQQFFEMRSVDMAVFGWEIVQKSVDGAVVARRVLRQPRQVIGGRNVIPEVIKSLGDDGRMYNLWNKIYVKQIIDRHGLALREDLRFGEDLIFNLNYLKHTKKIIYLDADPYYIYEEDSPTSIVSHTKLHYEFRRENLMALDEFASAEADEQTLDDLMFVKWRWLVSYVLAICGSGERFFGQETLVRRAVKDQKLRPRNASKQLSKKRYLMEIILFLLSKLPFALLLAMKLARFIKKQRHSRDVTIELKPV